MSFYKEHTALGLFVQIMALTGADELRAFAEKDLVRL
jgi:hypothetical protein